MEEKVTAPPQAQARVLLIAPQPFYQERGTPMNVRLMCTILGEAGYEVDLLVFPTGNALQIPGVRIFRLPNLLGLQHIPIGFSLAKLFMDGILIPAAIGLCLRHRYQVIHGIEEGGVIAVCLGRLFGTRTVYDMDSVISAQFSAQGVFSLLHRAIVWIESLAIRKASLVLTVCQALSAHVRSIDATGQLVQIEDIPLDFAFPVSEEKKRACLRAVNQYLLQHELEEKQLFLYTGNLERYQGIDLMLAAWAEARGKFDGLHKAHLVIVGGTEQAVAAYRETSAHLPGLSGVLFVGQRPAEEMGAWMSRADCLLSPRAAGENTPLKIYSYMSAGKPIIATRIASHTQVLTEDTAVLVDPEVHAMAGAIVQVAHNREAMSAKGEAAQADVHARFSYQVFAKRLLGAYASLLR